MTVTGSARRDGVSVEVAPGGALRSLHLAPEALHGGGAALSRTVLALVREATVEADQRAKFAMADQLGELDQAALAALGLAQDGSLTEAAEATTPERWRV
jgi:DNA-binding protein YbaB